MDWLWIGFGIGLVGSFHCAGMCGPIALALPTARASTSQQLAANVLYQLGRITTYASIGLLFGFFGRGFSLAGIQQPVSIFIGLTMVATVLVPRLFNLHKSPKFMQNLVLWIKKKLGHSLQKRGLTTLYITGLLNGLLPCGLVYMALLGALGIGTPMQSSAFMAAFGFGTFPMMFAIAFSGNLLSIKWRRALNKTVPYAVVILGTLLVLRGLGLGVHLVSPPNNALQIENQQECVKP